MQPLNAAKLFASSLLETTLADETRGTVEKLAQSINASETLIGTLLDIARLDQGTMRPSLSSVSVRKLLQPQIDEFSIRAKEKGLVFKANLHDLSVQSDSTYLYRIMLNLLSNAVKYTDNGRVVLTVRRRDNQVLFRVIDTGIGLTKEQQEKVFEDFYRCDSNTKTGVGLGLGIVRRFCVQLGIQLEMQLDKGRGSTFTFSLPIAKSMKQSEQSPSSLSTQSFKNFRVLCVDDQFENLDGLQSLLTKWNIQGEIAVSNAEALEKASTFKPNLLIVDYYLSPEHNGIDLTGKIREALGNRVPAIMVTASQDEDLRERCEHAAIHLLHKPLKPAKLRALLQRLSVLKQ